MFQPERPLNTAVLLVAFNRPEMTARVFEEIRKARPPRLYLASDGPRENKPRDTANVARVREILAGVDWPCDVETFFHSVNLGCGPAVKTAIDWFFEQEPNGIILEDDVLPEQSFFWFCEELLARYETDSRIGMISGINYLGHSPTEASYLFSKNKSGWGWATWERAWSSMDFSMDWLKGSSNMDIMRNMGVTKSSLVHWGRAIKAIQDERVSAWDWQWYFSLASQNQLTVFPTVNLIRNIGFGADATHTKGLTKPEFLKSSEITFPLKEPEFFCPDYAFDKKFEHQRKNDTSIVSWDLPLKIWRHRQTLYSTVLRRLSKVFRK